jgi:hypothetical protein
LHAFERAIAPKKHRVKGGISHEPQLGVSEGFLQRHFAADDKTKDLGRQCLKQGKQCAHEGKNQYASVLTVVGSSSTGEVDLNP